MSELFKIVLTACGTLFGGVIVFSIEKLIEKLYIERIVDYNRIWSQLDQILIFNAHKITNKVKWNNDDERITISNKIRRLSTELSTFQLTINYSWIIRLFTFIPKGNYLKAFQQLIELAVDIHLNKQIDGETFNRKLKIIENAMKRKDKSQATNLIHAKNNKLKGEGK